MSDIRATEEAKENEAVPDELNKAINRMPSRTELAPTLSRIRSYIVEKGGALTPLQKCTLLSICLFILAIILFVTIGFAKIHEVNDAVSHEANSILEKTRSGFTNLKSDLGNITNLMDNVIANLSDKIDQVQNESVTSMHAAISSINSTIEQSKEEYNKQVNELQKEYNEEVDNLTSYLIAYINDTCSDLRVYFRTEISLLNESVQENKSSN